MQELTPVSYDGFALNSGGYKSVIDENGNSNFWRASANENKRVGNFPLYASLDVDGIVLTIHVEISGSGTYQALMRVFNPRQRNANNLRKLIVQDSSSVQWSVYAVSLGPSEVTPTGVDLMLRVSQPVWIRETEATVTWNVTASGQTQVVTVGGNEICLPTLEITPTGANAGDYNRRKNIILYSVMNATATQYPLQIVSAWNTATLVSGGMLQADCDDVRVVVDGNETDHWLVRPNNADTDVWINLDLRPKIEIKLGVAIPSSGAVSEITFAKGTEKLVASLPATGAILIDSEVFTYTAVNSKLRKVGGVTRAARGTSMASHALNATCRFVEHEITLLYSNPNAEARVNDETKKPMFDLTQSDNETWFFTEFADELQLRSMAWKPAKLKSTGGVSNYYTDEHHALDDIWPANVAGFEILPYLVRTKYQGDTAQIVWELSNPFGIKSVALNGEKWRTGTKWPTFTIYKSVNGANMTLMHTETSPVTADAWAAVAIAEKLTNISATYTPNRIRLQLSGTVDSSATGLARFEVDDITLKMRPENLPVIAVGSEISTYRLDVTLTNTTTGDSIRLVQAMELTKTLKVYSDRKRILYEGLAADAALAAYPVRDDWLPLVPGANTLQLSADYTGNVTVAIKTKDRMVW